MSQIQKRPYPKRFQSLQQVKMQRYEMMPAPLGPTLKNSVWITLVTTIVYCIVYYFIPPDLVQPIYQSDFYILPFSVGAINAVIDFYQWSGTALLIANLVSLGLTILVLFLSIGLSKPIHEPLHYMVVADAIPAGVSTVTLVVSAIAIFIIVMLNVIVWIVVGTLIVVGFFGVLFSR